MTTIQALILGIVQGIAEFLPISSSGHLVLLQRIFNLNEGTLTFDIALHFASLIPIVIIFRDDIYKIIRNPIRKTTLLYIVGSIPIAIIGYLLGDIIEELFVSGRFLGIAFLITAFVLKISDKPIGKGNKIENISFIDAFFVGIFQAFAAIPGISRSGLTISGGLLRGMKKSASIKFAFLLGVPAILGAGVKDIVGSGFFAGEKLEVAPLIVGMLASAIFGFLALKFMVNVFSKIRISIFSFYVGILGILVIVDQLFLNIFFNKLF